MTLETPRTALLNMAPVPVREYRRMCHTAPTAQKFGFSIKPTLHLAFLFTSQRFNELLTTSELNQEAKASKPRLPPNVGVPTPPCKAGMQLLRP